MINLKKLIKEEPWYVEQDKQYKKKSEENKNLANEIAKILKKSDKISNLRTSEMILSPSGDHHSVWFDYQHPMNSKVSLSIQVRNDDIYKVIGGAVYHLKTRNAAKAVKDTLEYVDRVPPNRL